MIASRIFAGDQTPPTPSLAKEGEAPPLYPKGRTGGVHFLLLHLFLAFFYTSQLAGVAPLFAQTLPIATIPVGSQPSALAITPTLNIAAVLNQQDQTVSIIDLTMQSVVSTIPVGQSPSGLAVGVNGKNHIAVSNNGDGTLSLIDMSSGKVTHIEVGGNPVAVALAPHSGLALALTTQEGVVRLALVDITSASLMTTLIVGSKSPAVVPPLQGEARWGWGSIVVDEERGRAIVALSDRIILVDIAQQTVGTPISISGFVTDIALDATRGDAIITQRDGKIVFLSVATGEVRSALDMKGAIVAVTVNPNTDEAILLRQTQTQWEMVRINLSSRSVVDTLPLSLDAPSDIAVDPHTSQVGIVDRQKNSLSLYQLPHPTPVLNTISPTEVEVGEPLPLLRLTGSRFVRTSVVRAGATDLATQFISNSELTATLPATLFSTSTDMPITVFTPLPGGGVSAPLLFKVLTDKSKMPVINGFTPTQGLSGTAVTITGANFVMGKTSVRLDGFDAVITAITETTIQTVVPQGAPTASFYVTTPNGTAVSKTVFTVTQIEPSQQTAAFVDGEALTSEGDPLAGVQFEIGSQSAVSDAAGRFALPLKVGRSIVNINPSSVGLPAMKAIVDVGVEPNPHITLLLPEQATPGTTLMVSSVVPEGELIIPGGVQLKRFFSDPQQASSAVQMAPEEFGQDLLAVRPFDGSVPMAHGMTSMAEAVLISHQGLIPSGPVQVIHVNAKHDPAGSLGSLIYWDPRQQSWIGFSASRVSKDGRRVLPHGPGGPLVVTILSCGPGIPPKYVVQTKCPGCDCKGATCDTRDPIDAMTGALVVAKSDIGIPGLVVQRSYKSNDATSGPFGPGTRMGSDATLFPYGSGQLLYKSQGTEAVFAQQPDGTYLSTDTPAVAGAIISQSSDGQTQNLRLKNGRQQVFNTSGYLTKELDKFNRGTVQTRNAQNQVVSLASTDSQSSLAISYSGAQVTKVQVQDPTGALGASANYGYLNGRLDKVTDPTGGATQYGYDTVTGVMTTITDPRGITYLKNEYDTSGRVVKQTVADGGVSILAYSAETLPLPPLPPSIAPTYPDCTGALTITIALADSNSIPSTNCGVSYSYLVPPSGPVIRSQYTTITDARGTQTRMNFNDAGLVTSQVEALGTPVERTTTHEYDSVTNQKLATTDSLGRRTEYAYDAAGNLKTLTRLAGTSGAVSTTFTYEPTYNQVATITDPLLHVTTFSYDLKGSLIKVTDPQGKETLMTYNDAGRPLSLTDPLGHTTTFAYDPQGNLIQTIDPLGDATTRDYDLFNRLTALTNPSAFITQYGYDVINRLTQVNDTQGGGTAFTYDPNGNLLSVTDAKAQTTLYGYNNMDRLANRTDPLLASEGYLYDLEGNLQKFTDRKTQMAQFTYDALNRRTQAAYADGSTTIYTYDAGNRLTQIVDSVSGTSTLAYDNLDRLTSETTPQGIISYTYDAAGRRASMTVTGQATVTYAYDNANRVTGITQGSSIVAFAYDAAGRRISQTLPNGVVTEYSYDVASRLTEIKYMKGSTTLGNLTYSYDATGNKTRAGGTWASVSLPQAVSSTLYNANNQMTQFSANTLTYDANGNLTNDGTKTYSWDARNRLTSMSGTGVTASFMYDALGRRISKTINGVTTKYLYDGNDIVAEIKNGVVTATYLRSLNIDEPFMRTTATGQEFYHADALGSVMALTDSTGAIKTTYTYDPFGNTTVTGTSTNPFQYTGRENDGTGLYYYRARYYSPTLQRFLGEDPIFTLRCLQIYTGGKNAYAYVDNNPIRYVDPFGLDKNECPGRGQVCAVKCGLGGGVSGAVPCAFTTVITGQACDYVCGKIVGIPILDNILCDYICKPIFEKKKNECDRNTQKCVTECRSRC